MKEILVLRDKCITPSGKICGFAEEVDGKVVKCKIARVVKMVDDNNNEIDLVGMRLAAVVKRSEEAFRVNGAQPYSVTDCANGYGGNDLRTGWQVAISKAIAKASSWKRKK
jgi:hypothetical protein